MKVLVIGGTGTVGTQAVLGFLRAGHEVSVLTRSAEKAKSLPEGVKGAVGSLQDPATLPGALKDHEGLFLITALAQDETEQGLAAVEAATKAGVRRIVYMSVHRAEEAAHIPHFKTKLPIEKAIQESGVPYTILSPNNFFQNDLWFRDAIVQHGIYPQPIGGVGLSRVDVRDIADAAVIALTQPGHAGQNYPLVGPDVHTGDKVAGIYSRHLGREVRYAGDDLEAWAEQARNMLPGWLVDDLKIMYTHFQKHGLKATSGELARVEKILGRPPRSFDAFVAEIAPAWKTKSAAS